jgi:hypothetical protein
MVYSIVTPIRVVFSVGETIPSHYDRSRSAFGGTFRWG